MLITGGARSGKSHYAQELASKSGKKVLFVATAEAGDEEMRQRIQAHQRSRPAGWGTLEAPTGVGKAILKNRGGAEIIIVDCITMLVNNVFSRYANYTAEKIDDALADGDVSREIDDLIECLAHLDADLIFVTNEVGLGLVPPNPIDRLYRDLLGKANRLLAEQVDEVYMLVAGLPVRIKPVA
ncbi:MAG: bifunctional adenosylcobinamide kinase/adenosylcobinamide-phosphate guanylyltransferase [Chloroflexi bacterium]|nr:bifunctional adenosylcobinamide kinase/adenosylcobinamide-phosphate guanylyltransferase [Chloroflexota bacterium]